MLYVCAGSVFNPLIAGSIIFQIFSLKYYRSFVHVFCKKFSSEWKLGFCYLPFFKIKLVFSV